MLAHIKSDKIKLLDKKIPLENCELGLEAFTLGGNGLDYAKTIIETNLAWVSSEKK